MRSLFHGNFRSENKVFQGDEPAAYETPITPQEALDSDEELERELALIRANIDKNQALRDSTDSPLVSEHSEPGNAEYDYVSKVRFKRAFIFVVRFRLKLA